MDVKKRILNTKVSGVTFEGRQAYLAKIKLSDPCRIVPEPDNKFDPNALAVHVAHEGEVYHVGYVPRELSAEIAPHLEGEALMCRITEITGGFQTSWGGEASLGLRLRIEVPEELPF